jgi:enoyl-CoA hydratase
MADEQIVIVERDGPVGVVLMNRPDKLNALSSRLVTAIADALEEFDRDREIRAIVLGGGERAFAAGADIDQMEGSDPASVLDGLRLDAWDRIRDVRTPVVAAVSGYALGGGCELAMLCDLVVAAESAQFGQPEINLGIIPGAGGTQRLPRAVGKALAMDMVLTGRRLSAREALQYGLVARVVADEAWLEEAKRAAHEIAERSPVALQLAKEAVNQAYEAPLQPSILFERRAFVLARGSEDAAEGLKAFLEKRKAEFKGR